MATTEIKLSSELIQLLERFSDPEILNAILQEWAQLYRAEMLERFETLTRGGGEWPYLKFVRPKNRMAGTTNPREQNILWDEGFLVGSLQPEFQIANSNGGREEIRGNCVTIGFSKTVKHRKGQLTVQDIADRHQAGRGVPQRRILISPSNELVEKMLQWGQEALMKGKK